MTIMKNVEIIKYFFRGLVCLTLSAILFLGGFQFIIYYPDMSLLEHDLGVIITQFKVLIMASYLAYFVVGFPLLLTYWEEKASGFLTHLIVAIIGAVAFPLILSIVTSGLSLIIIPFSLPIALMTAASLHYWQNVLLLKRQA